jgi:hypothetical protein
MIDMEGNLLKKIKENPITVIALGITLFASTSFFLLTNYKKFGVESLQLTVLIIMFWALLLVFTIYWLIGKHIREIVIPQHNSKSRIALLVPISCKEDYENEDLKLMMEGFGEGISDFVFKTNKQLTETYEFVFIDNNNYDRALKEVEEEIKLGTKYFLSTLSSFSTQFTEQFLQISKDTVLINTISGTTSISELKNRVYNFYPTSEDEIDAIIDCIEIKKLNNPFIYNFNSIYTRECRDYFIKKWNHDKLKSDHISQEENSYEFINRSSFDTTHPDFIDEGVIKSEIVLIFGYGNSFYDLVNVLKNKCTNFDKKVICTISTFKYRDWKNEEVTTLKNLNVVTVRPKMKKSKFKTDKDVVKYFSEQSLDRLLNSLEKLNKDEKIDFDKAWELSYPRRLDLEKKRKVRVEIIEL